jgi:hypothetical protein
MGALIGLAGTGVTLILALLTVVFRLGHHSARLESLETWRTNVRTDMHEISEQMSALSTALTSMTTLISERTRQSHQS